MDRGREYGQPCEFGYLMILKLLLNCHLGEINFLGYYLHVFFLEVAI